MGEEASPALRLKPGGSGRVRRSWSPLSQDLGDGFEAVMGGQARGRPWGRETCTPRGHEWDPHRPTRPLKGGGSLFPP